jgi:steroid delta-isomerase-like uncharacterized protein
MSTPDQSARAVGLRWFKEVWQERNSSAITELLAPDAKGHLEGGQEIEGPEEFIHFHRELLSAIPNMELEVLRVLADETNVCLHWQVKGTHQGRGFGLEPTGKDLPFSGMTWFRVEGGKIVEGWDCWNQAKVTACMAGLG